jgi:putative transposase
LVEAGVEPSAGSKSGGDDNVLAETINDLYKIELIHCHTPWTMCEAVKLETLEWVSKVNHQWLFEPLGYIPPAEAEVNC